MGLLEKFKNIFTEEVEEEVEVPVKKEIPIKREIPKKEIPISTPIKKDVIKHEEEKVEEDPIKASNLSLKKEEKFVFPVYFDDKDFEDIKKEDAKPIKKVENKQMPDVKKGNYQDAYKEVHSKMNKEPEEKKVFKPTPIISPVYGILDKNYYKEDIVVSKPISRSSYTNSKEITIDDVRKKAFGTLEDDLENTLLSDENLNSTPRHASENNENSDIFNEMDFANAIEEDCRRDISKDGLKSDIESLLNNEEFMKEFNYRISSKKENKEEKEQDFEDININEADEKENKKETNTIDEDLTIEDLYEKNESYNTDEQTIDEDTTIDDLYEDNNTDETLEEDLNENLDTKEDYEVPSNLDADEDTDETLDDLYDVKDDISDDSDDEIDNAYNSSSDLNDSDLFNLIDSMYDKENK